MDARLPQADWDELSAFLDGELTGEALHCAEARLRAEPAWRAALEQLRSVDRLLEAWPAPQAPADLADRVRTAVRRRTSPARRAVRWAKWLAPLAAAAAVVLAVGLAHWGRAPLRRTGSGPAVGREVQPKPVANEQPPPVAYMRESFLACLERSRQQEQFVIENLDFFRDYDVLNQMETIQAIQALEASGGGT